MNDFEVTEINLLPWSPDLSAITLWVEEFLLECWLHFDMSLRWPGMRFFMRTSDTQA